MLYLILAILSSAAVSVIMRLSTGRVRGRLSMLAANYVVCTALAAADAMPALFPLAAPGFSAALWLGVVNGILYLGAFLLLQSSTHKNGIVLSSVFMKLGLLVSVAVSVFFFGEEPTALQLLGFALALAAIVLINVEKGSRKAGSGAMLILLLLVGGGADTMSKVFEVFGEGALSAHFLFYTFAMALLLCLAAVWQGKERPGWQEVLFGVLLGVPNFFAARFLLRSLSSLPAVIAYPSYSVAAILVVTLAGVVFFRERLGKRQWTALCMILAALVMLNV